MEDPLDLQHESWISALRREIQEKKSPWTRVYWAFVMLCVVPLGVACKCPRRGGYGCLCDVCLPDFNKQLWEMLKEEGAIAPLRRVLLEELRGETFVYGEGSKKIPCEKDNPKAYHKSAKRSYVLPLKDFLTMSPKGFW